MALINQIFWASLICFCLILLILPSTEQHLDVIIYDKVKHDEICIVGFQLRGKNISIIRTFHKYSIRTPTGLFNFERSENSGQLRVVEITKKEIDYICDKLPSK